MLQNGYVIATIRRLPKSKQEALAKKKGKIVSPQRGNLPADKAGPDLELLVGVSAEMPSGPAAACPKLEQMLKEGHKRGAMILVVDVGAYAGKINGQLKFNGVGVLAGALAKSIEDAAAVRDGKRDAKADLKKRQRLTCEEMALELKTEENKKAKTAAGMD
jgi:hypothetical protein